MHEGLNVTRRRFHSQQPEHSCMERERCGWKLWRNYRKYEFEIKI